MLDFEFYRKSPTSKISKTKTYVDLFITENYTTANSKHEFAFVYITQLLSWPVLTN